LDVCTGIAVLGHVIAYYTFGIYTHSLN
jgi:hypothetical protein